MPFDRRHPESGSTRSGVGRDEPARAAAAGGGFRISTAGRGEPHRRAAGILGQLPRGRGQTPGLPPRGGPRSETSSRSGTAGHRHPGVESDAPPADGASAGGELLLGRGTASSPSRQSRSTATRGPSAPRDPARNNVTQGADLPGGVQGSRKRTD